MLNYLELQPILKNQDNTPSRHDTSTELNKTDDPEYIADIDDIIDNSNESVDSKLCLSDAHQGETVTNINESALKETSEFEPGPSDDVDEATEKDAPRNSNASLDTEPLEIGWLTPGFKAKVVSLNKKALVKKYAEKQNVILNSLLYDKTFIYIANLSYLFSF